jgi:hypothetical protein
MANRPWLVGALALVYFAVTIAGMILFGRDEWLEHCDGFTVLFGIVGRFGPVEAEKDETGRISMIFLRPWGVGLLKPSPTGWDRVVFVILMLSTLAFDGIIATPAWQDFTTALESIWLPLGRFGFFFVRTLGLVLLTAAFLLIFIAFMEMVIYFGSRKVDLKATVSAFALTLVPIALVYNAAHNYSYVMVQSQGLIPLLNDPLARGWHLWPAVVNLKPSFALAQASTVWYAQVVLIVLGHVIAVYLSHLRAGERFRTAQRALLSQYPMLLLMVMYTMTSLWILEAGTSQRPAAVQARPAHGRAGAAASKTGLAHPIVGETGGRGGRAGGPDRSLPGHPLVDNPSAASAAQHGCHAAGCGGDHGTAAVGARSGRDRFREQRDQGGFGFAAHRPDRQA